MVCWSSCGGDQAVWLEELLVADAYGLKERRKKGEWPLKGDAPSSLL